LIFMPVTTASAREGYKADLPDTRSYAWPPRIPADGEWHPTLYTAFTHKAAMRSYAMPMKTKIILLSLVVIFSVLKPARACGVTPEFLAQQAVSTNALLASNAIVQLRRLGNEGLNALLKAHE